MIRLAGIVAIASVMAIPGSVAAAQPLVGLTECSHDGCEVVTQRDLNRPTRSVESSTPARITNPTDRTSPHFVP
ncbi:MAG TPA: hypothetical protein VFV93_18855 [Thermomicrobiales bacterium]|nr:hypothetical protein [Thermomicrobiales bacterium]